MWNLINHNFIFHSDVSAQINSISDITLDAVLNVTAYNNNHKSDSYSILCFISEAKYDVLHLQIIWSKLPISSLMSTRSMIREYICKH